MFVPVDFYTASPPSQTSVETGLPVVVNEELTLSFKYWDQGIKKGLRHNNELYTHFYSFSVRERLKAYEIAYEQAKGGVGVCITVSKTQYSIWVSLRSLSSNPAKSSFTEN